MFAPARLLAVKEIPLGAGWVYEPKFDCYRGLLTSSAKGAGSVWSRNHKDLGGDAAVAEGGVDAVVPVERLLPP